MRRAASWVLVVAAAAAGAAQAHHGIANFDLNKDLSLTGVVTQVAFVNPHSWLYLDVTGADGKITGWRCEMRSATVLKRSGWSTDLIRAGMRVTITGSPDRTDPAVCYLGTIVLPDGHKMDRYGQITKPVAPAERPARLADGTPNLGGDWAAEQRVMTDPRGISGAFLPLSVAKNLEPGAVPEGTRAFPGARGTPESLAPDAVAAAWARSSPLELTEAGKRAVERFDPSSSENPRLRCLPTNILFDWTFDTHVNRIVQAPDKVTLLYGFMDLRRTIHLDQSRHPADLEPTLAGHSIGRWEGDVLVVDTVGFTQGWMSADAATPHSEALHVIERFALGPDAKTLTRTYAAEDPLYFKGQWRGADTVRVADIPYEPYRCDDRSYRSDAPPGSEGLPRGGSGTGDAAGRSGP